MNHRITGVFTCLLFRRLIIPHVGWLPLLLVAVWGCVKLPPPAALGNWRRRSDFEGVARTAAAGFTIGTFAFIGTGSDRNNNRLNDFWSYDQTRNAWLQLANFPGVPRYGAIGFSVGSKGYIGLGADLAGNRLTDFYEYTPASDLRGPGMWHRIADFSGTGRTGAVAFVIDGKGYVGTGDTSTDTRDFRMYDPATGVWITIASYGGSGRAGAVALVINDVGYVGTGSANGVDQSDWWAYDPKKNGWLAKNKVPVDQGTSGGQSYGAGFTINGKGYLSQGAGACTTTWEYDPSADTWTAHGLFNGMLRPHAVGFSLGAKGYVTTGGSTSAAYDDLWEYDPTVP